MISQNECFNAIKTALSKGGDYCDIFIEERYDTGINLDEGKIKSINTGLTTGVGIRVITGRNYLYMFSSNPGPAKLISLSEKMAEAMSAGAAGNVGSPFSREPAGITPIKIYPDSISVEKKIDLLKRADRAAREYSPKIAEVTAHYMDTKQTVRIAASDGRFVTDERVRTRFKVSSIASSGEKKEIGFSGPGRSMGWEFFDLFSPEAIAVEAARIAVVMLEADNAPQGKMPVIIENEFGGVIFHEACGHALEATSVADNASVFSGKLDQMIASEAVSAVDDGTLINAWGSQNFDDEGEPVRKNNLIVNGRLNSYMIDTLGSIKMDLPVTGNSRRQDYRFAPTSRMTNTYIVPGHHTVGDLVLSIDDGLYCVKMGGGSVNPATTDFNFKVQEAYRIKNGKITDPVKGASLIGKGAEILKNIEMVADNLDYNGTGMCGSRSGSVPANVGQPAIKVSGLVVGGRSV